MIWMYGIKHHLWSVVYLTQVVNMYLENEIPGNVVISPEDLHEEGLKLQKAIILRLLDDISKRKATKEHGYFLAVTTLNHIGDGKVREMSGDVLFPVVFSCITFKPFKGEILLGVVDRILKHGVFLNCGPIENIFLSKQTMKDYDFIAGENPMFMNNKLSKLEKNAVVRFRVLGLKWNESDRVFQMLATLAGDFLGPIS
ncbi:DNA-directed RNA polymerase V subunit 7 [Cinnamomum micranthum f. kanehirae]|uniref:DNA-directed RNA polymerase subunit n=1 Tax=Cinnamomum micranthum f. kanehirae TaxID=337451 RepID=A0A3S3QSC7_9MAGN|nr:DNA-directed RNA polymerase V subunit 7 [Cinnamomum micranthum f. kanehirae]